MIIRPKKMSFINFLLASIILICDVFCSEVPRPRGVSLSRASMYAPDKDFTCFDNSLTIPFIQVNDDYCDCPDASDEPGTAACPHGIFHCTNAGHKPLNIASSRVNDGICDCCDASDEYLTGKCKNVCKELGRSAREEAQRWAELVKAGKQLRSELSEKGIKMKQEKKEKLIELQKQKAEADKVLKEKEDIKKEVEDLESSALEQYRKIEEENKRKRDEAEAAATRIEATETFKKFDSNSDGVIEISDLQTRQSFDKDRNGEVSEEEARYFLNEKDSLSLEEFISEAWPKIKPFLMLEGGTFKPPVGEGTAEEVNLDGSKEHEEYDEEEAIREDEDNVNPEQEEEEEEEEHETQQDVESSTIAYDDETQELVNKATQARNEFTEAEQSVRNIQNEITDIETYMKNDFGPDESFAAIINNCFEYSDYEYIYKLCPFDKATQQSKSGSIETRLGTWSKWTGPDNNKYETMLFDRGQSCWNGPTRSTIVKVNCNSENKLTAVSEPNRCEYLFEFSTPAACFDSADDQAEDHHDEL